MSSRFLWAVTDQMTPMTRMKVKVDIGYAALFCPLGRVNLHTLKAKVISTLRSPILLLKKKAARLGSQNVAPHHIVKLPSSVGNWENYPSRQAVILSRIVALS
jgi:hypothetical protein